MILSLSFMGTVVAGIIILIKALFKNRFNAVWHYYIWFLLIIRLIIPYAPESSLSIFNLLSPASQRIGISQNVSRSIDTDILLSFINEESAVNKDTIINNNSNIQNESIEKENGEKENSVLSKKNSIRFNYYMVSIIWLIGAIIMLLYTLIVNTGFLFKINKQPQCKEENILRNFDECKSMMNVHIKIPVIYDRSLKTPSLFGLIRPKLLIPSEIINNLSEEEKRYVFLHELAHFKRKDILINWIMMLVQILHWFNPIVWYAFYKMHEDCEIACDAYVLSQLKPVEYKKYGETIINLINTISKPYWVSTTIGMANNKSSIKRRIKMIAMFKKNSWKWSIIAVAVLVAVGFAGLTNSKSVASLNNKDDANILSKNNIDFNKDSYNESLIVKMTDGRYYEDKEPGAYMGSNWEGKFHIQLVDDKGNIISELDLNKAFNEQKLNFQSTFSIEFDDYNNDGNIDFVIGQYASSNGNTYKLFTISPDGKIEELLIEGQSEIFSSGGNRYSKRFEKIDMTSFKNQYYDNSKGKTVETYYSWSDNENQFIIKGDNLPQKILLTSEVENIISDNYVNDMKCTNEDIEKIIEYAEAYGIKNPYIPTIGVATDYIIEIRKDTEGLTVVYPHFAIIESTNNMLPADNSIQKKNVKLAIGDGEWWIDAEGTTRELYLHLDNIYIRIFSAKSLGEKEYIKIAESLANVKR
jgi:bla regulator protein BlaR1